MHLLWSTKYTPGTVLGAGNTVVNQTDKTTAHRTLTSQWSKTENYFNKDEKTAKFGW